MAEIQIRPAVSPDLPMLSSFQHTVQTNIVWQMEIAGDEDITQVQFRQVRLPRAVRIAYPRSPEQLRERWKNLSTILVKCVDAVPVAYISLLAREETSNVWIYDLAVHELWRRKSFATSLITSALDWGLARNLRRITIEMSSKNYPAICMAKKLGFEFCGYNDYYYANNDIAIFFARLMR